MRDLEAVKKGYALFVVSAGMFIQDIIPESGFYPGIYETDYLWEAKAWKTINGATKAATKVSKEKGMIMVCRFHFDEENRKRVIDERFFWSA